MKSLFDKISSPIIVAIVVALVIIPIVAIGWLVIRGEWLKIIFGLSLVFVIKDVIELFCFGASDFILTMIPDKNIEKRKLSAHIWLFLSGIVLGLSGSVFLLISIYMLTDKLSLPAHISSYLAIIAVVVPNPNSSSDQLNSFNGGLILSLIVGLTIIILTKNFVLTSLITLIIMCIAGIFQRFVMISKQ